jgi:hypothetical protein
LVQIAAAAAAAKDQPASSNSKVKLEAAKLQLQPEVALPITPNLVILFICNFTHLNYSA